MYSNFKEQAIEYIKQAVAEDNAGNYARAFPLYMNGLEYFKTHLKYEKNPKMREAITQKFTEYLHRVEEIRAVLDECGTGASSNAGDGVVAASLKMEPKDGEENTNNFSPNPNRSFNEQAFEYVKQAVQEDDAGNYSKALYLYMNALEKIITHLKFEKSPKIREAITVKFSEYVRRVEDLRAILDCRVEEIRTVLEEGGTGASSNGGDGEVVERLKTEPKDGEGSVGGGRELEMVELNSAIVREKPNVKSAASQRLCSCFCGNP